MNFEEVVTRRIIRALGKIPHFDFSNPSIRSAINSTVLMELVDIQDEYPDFDANADFDPVEELVVVNWRIGMHGKYNTFMIKFNPLRIEHGLKEMFDAYDHAMSIL